MPVVSIVPILNNRADARATRTRLGVVRSRLIAAERMNYVTTILAEEVGDLEEDYTDLCIGQDNLMKEAKIA